MTESEGPILSPGARWVVAREEPDRLSHRRGTPIGRLHAYDVVADRLAHPLMMGYTVEGLKEGTDMRLWQEPADGPRCRHCIEIAGPPRNS